MTKTTANDSRIRHEIKMSEQAFKDIILARLGIIVKDYQSADLQKTLLEGCQKLQCSPERYLKLLQTTSHDDKVYEHLIENITIGETYFFRDKHQMALLEKTILPTLIRHKREKNNLSLRIWSAGCSSGEEIYTVAIMLTALLPDLHRWSLHLLGTDINTKVLKKALIGEYTAWSMRAISEDVKMKFFTHDHRKNMFTLLPKIKAMAKFSYLNLSDDAFPMMFSETNAQDLILCRNVLIYFNHEKTQLLMHRLSSSLAVDGFLLLGASDPIITTGTHLTAYHHEGTTLSHLYVNQLKDVSSPKAAVPFEFPKRIKSSTPVFLLPPKKTASILSQLQTLLAKEKWTDILATSEDTATNVKDRALLFTAKATSAANLGKLGEAVNYCHVSLTLEPTNMQTYFTLAMSLIELNKIPEAKSALRKALFLDHQFVIGHYQLGLLLIRNNEYPSGMRSLKNAVTLAKTHPPKEEVKGFAGLTYGYLSEIFTKELELYQAGEGIDHGTKKISANNIS